jgi:DNA-binding LytR/AlgR family response regulator
MPDVSGIQLLKTLKTKPLVIITTAYEKYATEGFNLDVIDYLLKPYSFERFLKSINKASEYIELRDKVAIQESVKEGAVHPNYLFVRADYKLVKIDLANVLYIEGLKDYVKIYMGDKPVLTQMSMKALEEKLPPKEFVRVHRSFIVSFSKIDFIQKQMLTIGQKEIPISENYRDQLFSMINNDKTIL